jgi:diacylglycerol O-acyltransferase
MAQGHMDRLSALDVSFLTNESSSAHMHVGGIMIFEGPPPSYDDLLEHVRGRLHLVPRFRQKLAHPPAPTGRPFWVDDPAFNLEYHIRHSALPSPGSEEQLRNMAGRVFSQQLDRTKPLWELWMVQGLTRKRFALVTKTHHALVDGVSGVDIATVLFDVQPVPEPAHPEEEWVPGPPPSSAELLARDAVGLARTPLRALRRLEHAVEHPRATLEQVGDAAQALGSTFPRACSTSS